MTSEWKFVLLSEYYIPFIFVRSHKCTKIRGLIITKRIIAKRNWLIMQSFENTNPTADDNRFVRREARKSRNDRFKFPTLVSAASKYVTLRAIITSQWHGREALFLLQRARVVLSELVNRGGLIACRLIRYLHAACAGTLPRTRWRRFQRWIWQQPPAQRARGVASCHVRRRTYRHQLMRSSSLPLPSSFFPFIRVAVLLSLGFGGVPVFQLNRYNQRRWYSHCRCHLTRHADAPRRA